MSNMKCALLFVSLCFMAVYPYQAGYAASINIKYCIFFPSDHAQTRVAQEFCKEVERRTEGEVEFNLYTGGSVQRSPHIYDGVVKGIFDMGMSCFAYTKGRFPVMEAVDLPLGYPSARVASRVADTFAKSINPREVQDARLLYVHAHGPGFLHTKRAVRTPDELRGMIIRTTGHSAKIVNACGGTAIAMTQDEAYEALQSGIVDGTMSPISTLKGYGQAEVIDYTTQWYCIGYTTAMFVSMNAATWSSLPADVQQVFSDVSEEWVGRHGRAWDASDREGRLFTKELGNSILSLSEKERGRWKRSVQPVFDAYISKTPSGESHVRLLRRLIRRFSR